MSDGGFRPIKSLSELPQATSGAYYVQFTCIIVSVKLGNPNRLFVTDFTENKHMEQSFVNENWITDFSDRIPNNKILLLNTYKEKFEPFADRYGLFRGEQLPVGSLAVNVLPKAIVCRVKAKVKSYNGVLDAIANQIDILDRRRTNIDYTLPIFRNIFLHLPIEYISDNKECFKYTFTEQQIRQRLDFSNNLFGTAPVEQAVTQPNYQRHQQPLQNTPQQSHQQQSRSQASQTAPNRQHRLQSSPTPNLPDSSFAENTPNRSFKLSSAADLPSDSLHDRDYEAQGSPHTQVQATFDERSVDKIRKINNIDQVDGKVYEVKGTIVEFEPLLNQLCVKYEMNKPPILHPLTIVITDSRNPNQPFDETQLLKITFTTRTEIFNFLNMHEIEEIYIKSQQIYKTFDRILKSKNIFTFKVTRRLIKIYGMGGQNNFILGWEAQKLTLENLLDQI